MATFLLLLIYTTSLQFGMLACPQRRGEERAWGLSGLNLLISHCLRLTSQSARCLFRLSLSAVWLSPCWIEAQGGQLVFVPRATQLFLIARLGPLVPQAAPVPSDKLHGLCLVTVCLQVQFIPSSAWEAKGLTLASHGKVTGIQTVT